MFSFNRNMAAASCALVLIALVAIVAVGGGWYYLTFVAEDSEETVVAETKNQVHPALVTLQTDRSWTDTTGRTIDGQLITATEQEALVRVATNQRLYRIPRARLSGADNSFLTEWIGRNPDAVQFPGIPNRWPTFYDGRTVKHTIVPSPNDGDWNVWKTRHYEILSQTEVDQEILDGFVLICESIDNAMRRLPLPLLWGREENAERLIYIYANRKNYLKAGGMEHAAGHFDPATNEIHLRLDELSEVDMRKFFGQYTLKKRNQYNLIVHELVHQANYGLIATGGAAWLPEGLAEYMTAMQEPPGRFSFNKTQQAVRKHITDSLSFDGLVELKTVRIRNLSSFLEMPIVEFNRASASSPGSAICYYAGSLILTEYFCHGDNNSLRSFMEAVLTGVDEEEALATHLLRGRSPRDVEKAIQERWRTKGLEVVFEADPEIKREDLRGEVGLDSAISSFRRSL